MAEMLPRRQVGHHAAMALVQGDLAVHQLAHQAARRVEHRGRRLVARTLEREDHGRVYRATAWLRAS